MSHFTPAPAVAAAISGTTLGRARLDVAPGAIAPGGTTIGGLAVPLSAATLALAPSINLRAVIPWVQSGGVSPLWVVAIILEDGVQIAESIIPLGLSSFASITVERLAYAPTPGAHTYTAQMACGASTVTLVCAAPILPELIAEVA